MASDAKLQALAIVERVHIIMHNNLLLPCAEEIKQIRKMFPPDKDGNSLVKLNQKKGTIKIKMIEGEYRFSLSIIVNPLYPDVSLNFTITKSTFGHEITRVFTAQAERLVIKLSKGWSVHDALTFSINTHKKKLVKDVNQLKTEVTTRHLLSCKRDIKFLKVQTEMREELKAEKLRKGQARDFRRFCKREMKKTRNK